MPIRSVVGRGLSFPLQLNDRDRIAMVQDDADVRQAIRIIVMTVPGERVMRPSFGCRIHELIFHPANFQTAATAERYVREALTQWEPRITLEDVRVKPGNGELGELTIEIDYKLKDQPDPRTMTYPFYLVPGENGSGGENK
jgi:uncharacterized protein